MLAISCVATRDAWHFVEPALLEASALRYASFAAVHNSFFAAFAPGFGAQREPVNDFDGYA